MKDIVKESLEKQQLASTQEVEQILSKKLTVFDSIADFSPVWSLDDFHLNQTSLLQQASQESQTRLLHQLAKARFVEAYYIEKAGMSFSAKMSLLSESVDEQKLYSLFSAEEALHFNFIQQILGNLTLTPDPFIGFLNEVISSAPRRPLLFIIQVVLEGWGIDHYALMMKTCQNETLKLALQKILADEASHHGSGLSLFNEADLSKEELDYTTEMMAAFLEMVRIGPVGVLHILEQELGSFSESQRTKLLSEMNAANETQRKLNLLQQLILKAKAHQILTHLQAKQLFDIKS